MTSVFKLSTDDKPNIRGQLLFSGNELILVDLASIFNTIAYDRCHRRNLFALEKIKLS